MVPSFVAPHPVQNKAIVIFQSINTVSNFSLTKKSKFVDFEKDLRSADHLEAYKHLRDFFMYIEK
jgi:hypothetical protein